MSSIKAKISDLINRQLPAFISSEYEDFSKFVQKYYEQLELPGQPADIIHNLQKYRDIDTYEKDLLSENTITTLAVTATTTKIDVVSTKSFPEKNGYVLIDDEIIFYKSKTDTTFENCVRNLSGTTKLGDLYNTSKFKFVDTLDYNKGVAHSLSSQVFNISNLFLYAFVKNFETEYLYAFPEENLKTTVDKRILIKNIKKFYQSKGTDQSIKFIFNTIVSKTADDVPTVTYPKESVVKLSESDWIDNFALKVKVISGNPTKLVGAKIVQFEDSYNSKVKNASATIDHVKPIGVFNGESIWEITLDEKTVVGEFSIASKTFLTKSLNVGDSYANVYSTLGWQEKTNRFVIGTETFTYTQKNINQFKIASRDGNSNYSVNTPVYSYSTVTASYVDTDNIVRYVKMLPFGILYDLQVDNSSPYTTEGEIVTQTKSGFTSSNPIVFDKLSGSYRWLINNNNTAPSIPLNPTAQQAVGQSLANVSALLEDTDYFYIASSSFPSYSIGPFSSLGIPEDQRHLKLIKKIPANSTETYPTNTSDVGILINGVPIYSYKDEEDIITGKIENISVTSQGRGYLAAPFVINNNGNAILGRAVLSGEVVEKILPTSPTIFTADPTVVITSGRNAIVSATVTQGKVTQLNILNPGEFYSSPPTIIIKDSSGQGRSARYTANISNDGKIVSFNKEDEGKFYDQSTVSVEVVARGSGATAIAKVRRWKKNRFKKLQTALDTNYGYLYENPNEEIGLGYAQLANPVKLRIAIQDNLNNTGNLNTVLTHSKIVGYAYDGNPIYGPYAYQDPLDQTTAIVRMTSSYSQNTSRVGGPAISTYPLGMFIDDFNYTHRSGSLDENNGRFCITPEYPQGTYAYFVSVDASETPVFPYVIGKNYYSLPVDANYNKKITQDNIPVNAVRLRDSNTPNNGEGCSAYIEEINRGSVSGIDVQNSHNNFSVGSIVESNYTSTLGSGIVAKVSSIKGKLVESIECKTTYTASLNFPAGSTSAFPVYINNVGVLLGNTVVVRVPAPNFNLSNFTVLLRNSLNNFTIPSTLFASAIASAKIVTESNCYLFAGDTLTQAGSNATGQIIGNVFNDKTIVLRNISGVFNTTNLLSSNTTVLNLILDKTSSFTSGSVVTLTNGNQVVILNVTANFLFTAFTPFENGDAIIFSSSFTGVSANAIYYVVNKTATAFRIAATPGGTALTIPDNTAPSAFAISQKARGEILETTLNSNTLKVKVTAGTFDTDPNCYIVSSTAIDTVGSKIIQINSLSSNISIYDVDDKIAIVKTSSSHGLTINDEVNIDIIPDDFVSTVLHYVRRRIYQRIELDPPVFSSNLNDSGAARIKILNMGADYNNGTFTSELLFKDQTKTRAGLGVAGNANNAKVSIVVSFNRVISLTIVSKGKGYRKGDELVLPANAAIRSLASTSTSIFTSMVEHAGFGSNESGLFLDNLDGLSINDLLKIDSEIVKISGFETVEPVWTAGANVYFGEKYYFGSNLYVVSQSGTTAAPGPTHTLGEQVNGTAKFTYFSKATQYLSVIRAQLGTTAIDHYDNTLVDLHNPTYRFNSGYQLTGGSAAGYLSSYDSSKQIMELYFDTANTLQNIITVDDNSVFFDNSTPAKIVSVKTVLSPPEYKFEFSRGSSLGPWIKNPNIYIQKFYRYKFDTSHSSMIGSYLEFSPSITQNILGIETKKSIALPGYSNSFVEVKTGFGPLTSTNTFAKKQNISYNYLYYYDKANLAKSDNAYLELIEDPLQGLKKVIYVTDNRFVYSIKDYPVFNGTGNITYTTTSVSAIGKIDKITVFNPGNSFTELPTIFGVRPSPALECIAQVIHDPQTKRINSVKIINPGANYSQPKAILISGDGKFAEFEVFKKSDNSILSINVINKGIGYTYRPNIIIVETDVNAYYESTTIGVPKKIRLGSNGSAFNLDKTVSSKFTTKQILVLSDFVKNSFAVNEIIKQYEDNYIIAVGKIVDYKKDTNVLKIEVTSGVFQPNLNIVGEKTNSVAKVKKILTNNLKSSIKSYYDNLGGYESERGMLNTSSQRLADSYFYQDYSYVIKSKSSINKWRNLIKDTIHPAGFQLFGELLVESKGDVNIKPQQPKSDRISIVQLWDETKNRITVESQLTRRQITSVTLNTQNTTIEQGTGSVFVSDYNTTETRAYVVSLSPAFTGDFDQSGNRSGNKVFTMFQAKPAGSFLPTTPLVVDNPQNLIITIDGILQEPGKAFTVSGSTITFAEAPLGPRTVLGVPVQQQNFVGRYIAFKNNTYNNRYFKKIKQISQNSGRWLDAADQIEVNRNFIIEESFAYLIDKYPTTIIPNSTKCKRDIGIILDAISHDLKFGGNKSIVTAAQSYYNGNSLAYVNLQKTETLDAFKYAANAAIAATRNWDISLNNCQTVIGSSTVTLPSTVGIIKGMRVNGKGIPSNSTYQAVVFDVLNSTQIVIGIPSLSSNVVSTQSGSVTSPVQTSIILQDGTIQILPPSEVVLQDGSTFTAFGAIGPVPAIATFANTQLTFSLSGINNGTFFDASDLIEKNRQYIVEESFGFLNFTYPGFINPNAIKCKRDIGIFIDSIVSTLRFGGNIKMVEFGESYYTGNSLAYINMQKTETLATFNKAKELAILAMRNLLPAGQFTTIAPITDLTISVDTGVPACALVASAINTSYAIVEDVINNGPNRIVKVQQNPNFPGFYTPIRTISNHSIIRSTEVPECASVANAITTYYTILQNIINNGVNSVPIIKPIYFDGVETSFKLYYENNAPVELDSKENLIISLDGVLQESRTTPTIPAKAAYYINKTVIPNEIVFLTAPVAYDNRNFQKFFGLTAGNYERLKIEESRITGNSNGPFLMRSVVTNRAFTVYDDRNVLVFVDGVLQIRNKSYTINNSNITFSEKLKAGQNVNILVLYGRDINKTLEFYNYDQDRYLNRIQITVSTTFNIEKTFSKKYAFQGDTLGTASALGEIKSIRKNGPNTILIVETDNRPFGPGQIKLSGITYNNSNIVINANQVVSISDFVQDEDKFDILTETNVNWLYDSGERKVFNLGLSPGDQIRIDGESEFRRILSIPTNAKKIDYSTKLSYANIFNVTNYNEYLFGEGLDIVAEINPLSGEVVKLVWNQRDYGNAYAPISNTSGYLKAPILEFISQRDVDVDGNTIGAPTGGGAAGHVIIDKRGEIIDVVLTNPGGGYIVPPKVSINRGYQIIKSAERKIFEKQTIQIEPKINSPIFITSIIQVIKPPSTIPPVLLNPFGNAGAISFSVDVTNFSHITVNTAIASSTIDIVVTKNLLAKLNALMLKLAVNRNINLNIPTDVKVIPFISNNIQSVGPEVVGNRFGALESNKFASDEYAQVSGLSIYEFNQFFPTLTIQQFNESPNLISSISIPSINNYMAYLDQALTESSSIIYVPSTSRFAPSGKLLVEDEIVTYTGKLSDRFTGVTRGVNTVAKSHAAGALLRTLV